MDITDFLIAINNFPEDVRFAFETIRKNNTLFDLTCDKDKVELIVNDSSSIDCTLVLTNAEKTVVSSSHDIEYGNVQLTKSNDKYCLQGNFYDVEKDCFDVINITFDSAYVQTNIFRADELDFYGTPWSYLYSLAFSILEKTKISNNSLNQNEKELLPLLKEIINIDDLKYEQSLNDKSITFAKLKAIANELNFIKITSLLEKLEITKSLKQYARISRKLEQMLNSKNYEPFWRNIYCKIIDSQKEYKHRKSQFDSKKLNEIRQIIQNQMQYNGYSGTYPDFYKRDIMKGLHLAESYDMTYFVGMSNKAEFHIHCYEDLGKDYLNIHFLCGTALLRKNETTQDIYSCLFNDNGHRLYNSVYYSTFSDNEDWQQDLERDIKIAIKRAELKPLTKYEKGSQPREKFSFSIFLFMFTFFGAPFAVFITIGFVLIELILMLIFGDVSEFPQLFMESPWWLIFILSWVGFGGAMSLINIFAKNK